MEAQNWSLEQWVYCYRTIETKHNAQPDLKFSYAYKKKHVKQKIY